MKEVLITSSVLIPVILLVRMFFQGKVSQRLIYGVWVLVALRLLIPVQLFSLDFSVLSAAEPLIQTIADLSGRPLSGQTKEETYRDILQEYLQNDQSAFIPEVQEQLRQDAALGIVPDEDTLSHLQEEFPNQELLLPAVQQQVEQELSATIAMPTFGQIAKVIWIVGMVLMAEWFILINIRYRRKIRRSRMEAENVDCPIPVYVTGDVGSPCLVGTFRPAVYLTPESAADPAVLRHVLTHELTHWRHYDHIFSLLRCLCLCVYWFNPLVWLAAYYSRRDCELACDEGAILRLGEEERIAYGRSLLDVVSRAATPVMLLQTATSMNETKRELKRRVALIAKKRKISVIAVGTMAAVCFVAAGFCSAATVEHTDPVDPADDMVTVYLLAESKSDYSRNVYTYDQRGQLLRIDQYDAQIGGLMNSWEYTHDFRGNLTSKRKIQTSTGYDRTYFYTYTYDEAGRLTSFDDEESNPYLDQHRAYNFIYDGQGRLVKVTTWEISGERTVYALSYDASGRVLRIWAQQNIGSAAEIWTYTYDAMGRVLSSSVSYEDSDESHTADTWSYPANGAITHGEYTAVYQDGLLSSVTHEPGSDSPKTTFEVDTNGNITACERSYGRTEYTYIAVELSAADAALRRPYLGPYELKHVVISADLFEIYNPLYAILPKIDPDWE